MSISRILRKKRKTLEEEKFEAISSLAKNELKRIMDFGVGLPVTTYKI